MSLDTIDDGGEGLTSNSKWDLPRNRSTASSRSPYPTMCSTTCPLTRSFVQQNTCTGAERHELNHFFIVDGVDPLGTPTRALIGRCVEGDSMTRATTFYLPGSPDVNRGLTS